MADHLITYLLAVPLLTAWCAQAEVLPDPTRPPSSEKVHATAADAEPKTAALQSIILSRNRRAAIIDGETVELGGLHGDARLLEVNEGSVVLSGAQGRRVLTLFPGVRISGKQDNKTNQTAPVGEVRSGQRKARPETPKEEK
ncbi:MAG: hypothetical protein HYZ46_05155 [Nitrosomonadales bacterium]|nr:hypothetical protein [Nitrosomonadales bacterium]